LSIVKWGGGLGCATQVKHLLSKPEPLTSVFRSTNK
jgi:hypothetical protein